MMQKPLTEEEKHYKAKAEAIPIEIQSSICINKMSEKQHHENIFCTFECTDFDSYYQQNQDFEEYDDSDLFNDNFHFTINYSKENMLNSNNNLNCSNVSIPFNKKIDQFPKNIKINSYNLQNNQTQIIQYPFFESSYFQDCMKNDQIFNSNYQLFQNYPQNRFGNKPNILFKKIRKRRGTGDEAQKRHPNDDFKFENKPCYLFLSSISHDIYRSKCTFEIINKVANVIEQLNPRITKRTRMERRRKSVQLCWFHNNWVKIYKMKDKIIEKLTAIENENQAEIQH